MSRAGIGVKKLTMTKIHIWDCLGPHNSQVFLTSAACSTASRQNPLNLHKSVRTKAKTLKRANRPNKTNFGLMGWQNMENNEIMSQTMNCTQNLQKNAETSNFDDFWAICVRKRIFQEFSKFPLFGPFSRCFPAVFPLFGPNSRCFPAVFPLFSRRFPAVFLTF